MACKHTKRTLDELSGAEHATIGGLAGMSEVCVQQPTIAIKNAIQQNQPVCWKPSSLYRGLGVSCLSIAPIVGVQFGVNGVANSYYNQYAMANDLPANNSAVKILIAAFSGMISSSIGGPAELVMTLQQRTGHGFFETVSKVTSQFGFFRLYRGIGATIVRDSVWTASFLALGPCITSELHSIFPQIFDTEKLASPAQKASASMAGSIIAGLVTVGLTQPVDTIKTVLQGKALSAESVSTLSTTRYLYSQGGAKYFYKGTVPRAVRLVGAVFILNQSRNLLEEKFMCF